MLRVRSISGQCIGKMLDMHPMHDVPDLDLLRCFVHLHRERHLTRAAKQAGLSQPAMSRALGRLRTTFGDPLFVRASSGMVPTPRAEALAPQIKAVLHAAGALVQPVRFDPAQLSRTFVIGSVDFSDVTLVPPLVDALQRTAPGVSITTRPLGEGTGEALASGQLDLVVGVPVSIPGDAMTSFLFEDGYLCAVRRDHPGVGRRLTLERYVELPHLVIAPRGAPGSAVDAALEARKLMRRVVVRTHTFLSAPAIVASSDLVLTAPSRLLEQLAPKFGLRLLPPPLPLPRFKIWQAWHPRVQHDPAHAWFRGKVAAAAKAQRDNARAR